MATANHERKRLAALRRRVNRARNFPTNTDPYSRHVHIMAEWLLKPQPKKRGGPGALRYPMLQEEPEHCAESLLVTLAELWEARTELAKLKER